METIKTTVLFYFSGTGNTRYVANAIASALPSAIARSIEGLVPSEADALIADNDVVGIGYPVYGSDLPKPMKDSGPPSNTGATISPSTLRDAPDAAFVSASAPRAIWNMMRKQIRSRPMAPASSALGVTISVLSRHALNTGKGKVHELIEVVGQLPHG